jgi:hypothetical protein
MKANVAVFLLAVLLSSPSLAAQHPCESDARAHAGDLLKLHFDNGSSRLADEPGAPAEGQAEGVMNWSLGDMVKALKPIKALKGKGRLDVLEIEGYIYKATYRMRFIFVQSPGSCALMGQEIIEVADPY